MSGFVQFSTGLPALFPIVEDCCRVQEDRDPNESAERFSIGHCFASQNLVLADGPALTFASWVSGTGPIAQDADIQSAIEFESPITNVVWDLDGLCTAVCDAGGTLHLVKQDGSILLSKQVLAGLSLSTLQFIDSADGLQSLVGITSNGEVLSLANLDIAAMCEGGSSLMAALKNMKFSKRSLDIQSIRRAVVVDPEDGGSVRRVVILSENGQLQSISLDTAGSTAHYPIEKEEAGVLDKEEEEKEATASEIAGEKEVKTWEEYTVTDFFCWQAAGCVVATTEQGFALLLDSTATSVIATFYMGAPLHSIDLVELLGEDSDGGTAERTGCLMALAGSSSMPHDASMTKLFSVSLLYDRQRKHCHCAPHGFVVVPSNTRNYGNVERSHRLYRSGSSHLSIACFSSVSKALARDIFLSWSQPQGVNVTSAESIPRQLPFGKLLGYLLSVLSQEEGGRSYRDSLLKRILQQRFAPEIILAAAFLLNNAVEGPSIEWIAEAAMAIANQFQQATMAENVLFESQVIAKQWMHLVQVAGLLFGDAEDEAKEERAGSKENAAPGSLQWLEKILPDRLELTMHSLLAHGHLAPAITLLEERLWKPSEDIGEALGEWLDMLPEDYGDVDVMLQYADLLLHAIPTHPLAVVAIVRVLLQRAERFCMTEGQESAALSLASQALLYLSPIPDKLVVSGEEVGTLRSMLEQLTHQLQLHAALLDILQIYLPIEDIKQFGWEGLVSERLQAAEEEDDDAVAAASDGGRAGNVDNGSRIDLVLVKLRQLTDRFSVDLDSILSDWVRDKIDSSLTSMHDNLDSSANSLGDDEQEGLGGGNCAAVISTVIRVISFICKPSKVAPLLLKLFQLSSFCCPKYLSRPSAGASAASVGETLCAVAAAYLVHCQRKERDELVEAMRLFRIRSLGYQYGIHSIELCDATQLSSALSIISNATNEHSVQDAVAFAMEEDGTTIRLGYVVPCLIRKVTTFITTTAWDDMQYDKLFSRLLVSISPTGDSLRVITEDALMYCVDEHSDLCRKIAALSNAIAAPSAQTQPSQRSRHRPKVLSEGDLSRMMDEVKSLQTLCKRLVKGIVKLVELSTDKIFNAPGNASTSSSSSSSSSASAPPGSAAFAAASSVTVELCESLPYYRRLLQLHTQYEIYVTIQEMKCPSSCIRIVETLTADMTSSWLEGLPRASGILPGDPQEVLLIQEDLSRFEDIIVRMHKVCRLLNASVQLFVKVATKKMVDAGRKKLAIAFAKSQLERSFIVCGRGGQHHADSGLSANQAHSASDGNTFSLLHGGNDWEAILDTVKIISTTALTQTRSTGYYSSATEQSVEQLDAAAIREAHELAQTTLRKVVSDCPPSLFNRALDLLNVHDLVLATYDRMDRNAGSGAGNTALSEPGSHPSSSTTAAAVSMAPGSLTGGMTSLISIDSIFSHDGLLLEEDAILPPLLHHCVAESKRREMTKPLAAAAGGGPAASSDVEGLVKALQRNENHMLALRVLYSSWTVDAAKAQMIRSSLLALTRKILTYREVDENFAISCLSGLDLDTIVKELKSAVPTSLHSDFNRLKTVAYIGEEMAHLWEEDSMLMLFQGLQTNAKWWHILSTVLHIQVDLKAFSAEQSYQYQYIRSLVPEILKKTQGDLAMASEYCRSFDIEPEIAALQYIEYMLCQPPISNGETMWSSKVKAAALGLKESDIIRTLHRVLKKIHEVDYEKIAFVCTWLLQLTPEDQEIEVLDGDEEGEEGGEEDEDLEQRDRGGLRGASSKTRDVHAGSRKPRASREDGLSMHDITVSFRNVAAARAMYLHYIDLTKFLTSVGLPSDVYHQLIGSTPAASSPFIASSPGTSSTTGSSSGTSVHGGSHGTISKEAWNSLQQRLQTTYSPVPEQYQHRLPFWMLTMEPWTLLTALFALSEWAADKLLPACILLQLNKEDFHARAILASYLRSSVSMDLASADVDHLATVGNALRDHHLSISAQIQVHLWIYHHEYARGFQHQEAATLALQTAIQLLQTKEGSQLLAKRVSVPAGGSAAPADAMAGENAIPNVEDLRCKLLRLKVERTLNQFMAALWPFHTTNLAQGGHGRGREKLGAGSSGGQANEAGYGMDCRAKVMELFDRSMFENPLDATERALEVVIEFLWDQHIQDLTILTGPQTGADFCASISIYQLSESAIGRRVLAHLQAVLPVLQTLYQLCSESVSQFTAVPSSSVSPSSTAATTATSNSADVSDRVIASMIAQFLLDNNHVAHASSAATTTGVASASSVTASSSTLMGTSASHLTPSTHSLGSSSESAAATSVGQGGDAASHATKGLAEVVNPNLPTGAEFRRREDLFLGFAIFVLARCMATEPLQSLVFQQLEQVMKGVQGFRTASHRRLNARSRWRACQALYFHASSIQEGETQGLCATSVGNSSFRQRNELHSYRRYYFCLSELQEIRVVCSEEALATALQCPILAQKAREPLPEGATMPRSPSSTFTVQQSWTSTRSILLTWLHDERNHAEALELVRDLYVVSGIMDESLLHKLVKQLMAMQQYRALWVLLHHLDRTQRMSELVFYSDGVLSTQQVLLSMLSGAYDCFSQTWQGGAGQRGGSGWMGIFDRSVPSSRSESAAATNSSSHPSSFSASSPVAATTTSTQGAGGGGHGSSSATAPQLPPRVRHVRRLLLAPREPLLWGIAHSMELREVLVTGVAIAHILQASLGSLSDQQIQAWQEAARQASSDFVQCLDRNWAALKGSTSMESLVAWLSILWPKTLLAALLRHPSLGLQRAMKDMAHVYLVGTAALRAEVGRAWMVEIVRSFLAAAAAAGRGKERLTVQSLCLTINEIGAAQGATQDGVVAALVCAICDGKVEDRVRVACAQTCLTLLKADGLAEGTTREGIRGFLSHLSPVQRTAVFQWMSRHRSALQSYTRDAQGAMADLIAMLR